MNEIEIKCIMNMARDYLNTDVSKLSRRTNEDIISNLLELNKAIVDDNFSMYINPGDIREAYNLIEECSKVKGTLKPLLVSVEHNFFDFMVNKNFLQDIKSQIKTDSLRDYELSRYSKLLQEVCLSMNDKPVRNMEIEKLSLEQTLNRVSDALIIRYYSNKGEE
jgi:hypothetical protein